MMKKREANMKVATVQSNNTLMQNDEEKEKIF